jgi:cellulose synthase/poly-beta-1,6-N-acetylglucosamine synthase-like glycosyltransferase
VQYEYLSYNIVNYLLSKKVGKSFMINGSGFAVKKEFIRKIGGLPKLVIEDVGLALEIIRNNSKFKFTDKAKIKTEAPRDTKSYLKQRARWGFGGGEAIREYFFPLGKFILNNFWIVLPTLFLYYPLFIFLFLFFLSFFNLLISFCGLILFLLCISCLFLFFSKKLDIKINLFYLPIYFIYTLFSFFILFFYSIKGFRGKITKIEWKI